MSVLGGVVELGGGVVELGGGVVELGGGVVELGLLIEFGDDISLPPLPMPPDIEDEPIAPDSPPVDAVV